MYIYSASKDFSTIGLEGMFIIKYRIYLNDLEDDANLAHWLFEQYTIFHTDILRFNLHLTFFFFNWKRTNLKGGTIKYAW